MERGRLEVIIEAQNRAGRTLRQFGGQVRRVMANARRHVAQAGRAMRVAGEDMQHLGVAGRFVGRGLQMLGALAIRPILGLITLLSSVVVGLVSGLVRLASAGIKAAMALTRHLLAAARSLIRTFTRLALVITAGLIVALGVAGNKAASFEQEMRNVNTIVRASEARFAAMSEEVLQLSTVVPQTAEVLARGMYNIASAGFKGAEGLQVLEVAAHAAVAGLAETDQAAKAITAVLNAYGLSAESAAEASDILFKVIERGVVTFPELADSIGVVVGTAAAAKVPFEELAAAYMTMTKGSINAATATTALNRIILTFLDPPKELAAALRRLGIDSAGAFIQLQGLGEAIKVLNRIAAGNPAILAEIGIEMRALRAAMSLVRQEGRIFAEDIAAAYQAAGATTAAYAEQSKALRVQLALMKSSVAAIAVSIGQMLLPVLQPVVRGLGRIADKLREWIKAHPEIARAMERLGDAVAELVDRAEGKIENWLDALSENWESVWSNIQTRAQDAAEAIAGSVGYIVGAVQELYSQRGVIWAWARDFVEAMASVASYIADHLLLWIHQAIEWIQQLVAKVSWAGGVLGRIATQAAVGKMEDWQEGILRTRARMPQWRQQAGEAWEAWRTGTMGGFAGDVSRSALQEQAEWKQGWGDIVAGVTAPSAVEAVAGMQQLAKPELLGYTEAGEEIWSAAVWAFGDSTEQLTTAAHDMQDASRRLNDGGEALAASSRDIASAADGLRAAQAAEAAPTSWTGAPEPAPVEIVQAPWPQAIDIPIPERAPEELAHGQEMVERYRQQLQSEIGRALPTGDYDIAPFTYTPSPPSAEIIEAASTAAAAPPYTAAEQVEWSEGLARYAEAQDRNTDALHHLADALYYQQGAFAEAGEQFGAAGTQESLDALIGAAEKRAELYRQVGAGFGLAEGQPYPQFAGYPEQQRGPEGNNITINFQFDTINSLADLQRAVDEKLAEAWREHIELEAVYGDY